MDKQTKNFLIKYFDKIERRFDKTLLEIKKGDEKNRRYFGVVAEKLDNDIKLLAEQVAGNTVKLEEHDQRFDKVENKIDILTEQAAVSSIDINAIKTDIADIKKELKNKADAKRAEILEQKVSQLELKMTG